MKNKVYKKIVVAALAALAVSCNSKEEGVPKVANSENGTGKHGGTDALSGSLLHSDYETSQKYIDTDAKYVSFKNISDANSFLGNIMHEADRELAEGELSLPKGVSISKLFKKSQLDKVRSVASSSKKVDGGYLNKLFVDLGGARDGAFSVFKGMGKEWSAYEFAPSGTDYIQEFDLNIEDLRETLDYILDGVDEEFASMVKDTFEKAVDKQQALKMTVGGVHFRVALIGKMDRKNRVNLEEEIDFPSGDVAVRIEGLNEWLKIIDKELKKNTDVKSINGYTYYTPKDIPPTPEGVPALSPKLVVNESKNEVWMSIRSEFLEECLGSGKKLKDDPEFAELKKELPEHGNILGYLSHEVIKELDSMYKGKLGGQIRKGLKQDASYPDPFEEMVSKMLLNSVSSHVFPMLLSSKSGFVATTSINKDGILMMSKTPLPNQGQFIAMPTVALPILSTVASPIILRQHSRSKASLALNNSKDIYVGIRSYAFSREGDTPGKLNDPRSANKILRELFEANEVYDEKPFFVSGVEGFKEGDGNFSGLNALAPGENVFAYVPGSNIVSDDANMIIRTRLIQKHLMVNSSF